MLRLWKKLPKHDDFIPSMPVNEAINEGQIIIHRWQAHKDWVLMVMPLIFIACFNALSHA